MPRIDVDLIEEEYDDEFRAPRRKLSQAAQDTIEGLPVGRVLGTDRGHVDVLLDGEQLQGRYGGQMRGKKVVVGDRVRVRPRRHETDTVRIVARLERESALVRTGDDADDDERVVVANADQVAIVLGADYLEGGVGFLDRVLVAASTGGLDALIVVNKMDLADPTSPEVAGLVDGYVAVGYAVVTTSAETGEGVDRLREKLAGCWTAFTGHSGVGKSSLFNRLLPDAAHEVGEIGSRGGRHTTVASRARPVPGLADTWLIDTPGVRSFGLGLVDALDLAPSFPELAGLACDLDDCLHDGEPGCAIDTAEISAARLASYRRLLAAVGDGGDS